MARDPVRYSAEIADEILDRLADGEALKAICRDDHMPCDRAVRFWIIDDVEGFAPRYARARDAGLDRMAEDLVEISDTTELGQTITKKATGDEIKTGDMIEHRRLRVEARKWYLAKLAPNRYGDKIQVDQTIKDSRQLSEAELDAEIARLTAQAAGRSGSDDGAGKA